MNLFSMSETLLIKVSIRFISLLTNYLPTYQLSPLPKHWIQAFPKTPHARTLNNHVNGSSYEVGLLEA